MSNAYGDDVQVKEDMDKSECPFCGNPDGMVIIDYTGFHTRETMIHCPDCDGIYIRVYKFSYIIKLNKEEVQHV